VKEIVNKNKLTVNSKIVASDFMNQVKQQYVEKYARDMVNILDDQARLERALTKVNAVITAVQKGDYAAIEKYKRARRLLEVEGLLDVEEDVEL
jgi:hypothetical protein